MNWKVIDFLTGRAATEAEIAETLKIPISHLRAPLRSLLRAGLLAASRPLGPNSSARAMYSLRNANPIRGFPPRNYLQLSESLIAGMVGSLGYPSARLVMRDVGFRAGEGLGQFILARAGSDELGPDGFVEVFLDRILTVAGAYPHLIRKRPHVVEYEQFNCPFQELADKFPGLLCDGIDEGVHLGLDRRLGVRTRRLSCKGYGSTSCRFRVTWPEDGREEGQSRVVPQPAARLGRTVDRDE